MSEENQSFASRISPLRRFKTSVATIVAGLVTLSVVPVIIFGFSTTEAFWIFIGNCTGFLFGTFQNEPKADEKR